VSRCRWLIFSDPAQRDIAISEIAVTGIFNEIFLRFAHEQLIKSNFESSAASCAVPVVHI
jgi:hypothetical protein